MDICYLCGQVMVDRKDYTVDNSKPIPKFKHDEHIIQNALYGRLTACNILCEICGSKLSKNIDAEFVKLFDLFTAPISHSLAPKDHGKDFSKTLFGYLIKKKDGEKIDVHIKEGKIAPKKPVYDYIKEAHTLKIYGANKKALENYKKFSLKELQSEGVDIQNINIELIDDIKDYHELGIYFSEKVEFFNSKFKLGLSKIATGFAASKGVKREDMPCTLNIQTEEIIANSNTVPFFPLGSLDFAMESARSLAEEGFPTHTLILYTDKSFNKTKLVCYIDLFSTFQYYVVLNHNYNGNDISEIYYQTIIKREKPNINIRNIRPKHLMIIAEDLGVTQNEMRGMTLDERYTFLERKHKQYSVKYTLDLNDYISNASGKFFKFLAYKKLPQLLGSIGNEERLIIEGIPELDRDDLICLKLELKRTEEEPIAFYRKEYLDFGNDKKVFSFSMLNKLIELTNSSSARIKSYTNYKFYLLFQFVSVNSKNNISDD